MGSGMTIDLLESVAFIENRSLGILSSRYLLPSAMNS